MGLLTVGLRGVRQWSRRDQALVRAVDRSLNLAVERAWSVVQLRVQRETLTAANEELEAFAYSASHDLRTRVRHIAGYTNLLRRALDEHASDRTRHYVEVVEGAAQRMHVLIDAMLELSRTARLPLRERVVDLEAPVRQVQVELATDVEERRVEWRMRALPTVQGDEDTLRQVLLNVLSNALKYTRPRDTAVIEVWAHERPEEVAVFVRDNGVGFDPRYEDKLFGVFRRLHRAEEFEGGGVGLATVRRIIHRHGGQVSASGAPGAGATFTFTLPRRA